jgi:hypothetical protein
VVLEKQTFAQCQLYVRLLCVWNVRDLLVTQVGDNATVTNVVSKELVLEDEDRCQVGRETMVED